jgi:AcrR family transcriptional regulator
VPPLLNGALEENPACALRAHGWAPRPFKYGPRRHGLECDVLALGGPAWAWPACERAEMKPTRGPAVPSAVPLRAWDDRPPRRRVTAAQRARILAAMIRVVGERGVRDATVEQVVNAAGVSRRTFYDLFADRDECMLVAIEQTAALAGERAGSAWAAHRRWIERVRAGLWALLEFFEEDPDLAKLCIVNALQASPAILARRRQTCEQLALRLDEGSPLARSQSSPLTAEGVVGGALAILHARLLDRPVQPLTDVFNDLMSFIVLPYLGARAAREELARPLPQRSARRERRPMADPLEDAPVRLTYRTMRVLAVLADEPGLKNSQVCDRSGITDEGQGSKLLGRLAGVGLIENAGLGARTNAAKAWQLTPAGERLERSIRRELP